MGKNYNPNWEQLTKLHTNGVLMYIENLKLLRKELGLSVAKFSDKLGMSASTLTGYERGERTPSVNLFTQLYLKLAVNLNWFVSGKGAMFEEICENSHILVQNEMPEINYKNWGKRLGQILSENKETPYSFSKRTGIKESRIENFILDSHEPRVSELNAIKSNVDISIDWLLYGENVNKVSAQTDNISLSTEEILKLKQLLKSDS